MKIIYAIVFFMMKTTGIPLELIFFKRKTYYQNRKVQKRRIKGGALIVSNHHSFWDYITIFFLFFFYRVRPIVSYEIMHKNKVLTFCLNVVGAITVGKDPLDVNYINEAVKLIKKGKKVIVYPEGHFAKPDQFLPFSSSYLKIAKEANCPIIPLYTDGHYGIKRRNHVTVGTPIYVSDLSKDVNDSLAREESNNKLLEIFKNFQEISKKRSKTPLFSFKLFFLDLGRMVLAVFFFPWIRSKIHNYSKRQWNSYEGPIIIAANHISFLDPIIIIKKFMYRRVNFLVAKEVFINKKVREKLIKSMGGIRIDRDIFDIDAINNCVDVLNKGRALLVFPEGHIIRDGEMNTFKRGITLMSARTNTKVLPLYIAKSKKWYHTHHIYVGDPIDAPKFDRIEMDKSTIELMNSMKKLEQLAKSEGR